MKKKRLYLTKERIHIRNKILNAHLRGDPIYVKDSGIKAKIINFSEDQDMKDIRYRFHIMIEVSTPTVFVLDKFHDYRLQEQADHQGNYIIRASGQISLLNLSTTPFDTPAANTLYGKSSKD